MYIYIYIYVYIYIYMPKPKSFARSMFVSMGASAKGRKTARGVAESTELAAICDHSPKPSGAENAVAQTGILGSVRPGLNS